MTSSDVETERLELHRRVVRECEVTDAAVTARGHQAAGSTYGGAVDRGAGEASSALLPYIVGGRPRRPNSGGKTPSMPTLTLPRC